MTLVFMFTVDGHVPARINVAELGVCMWFGHPVTLDTMTVVVGGEGLVRKPQHYIVELPSAREHIGNTNHRLTQ